MLWRILQCSLLKTLAHSKKVLGHFSWSELEAQDAVHANFALRTCGCNRSADQNAQVKSTRSFENILGGKVFLDARPVPGVSPTSGHPYNMHLANVKFDF